MLNRLQICIFHWFKVRTFSCRLFGELEHQYVQRRSEELTLALQASTDWFYLPISAKCHFSAGNHPNAFCRMISDNPAKNVKGLAYRLRQKFSIISDERHWFYPLRIRYQLNPSSHYDRLSLLDELVSSKAVRASSVINKVDILKMLWPLSWEGLVLRRWGALSIQFSPQNTIFP